MKATFLLIATLVGFASTTYEGHKVYKVFPKTYEHNSFLISLEASPDFDFWTAINKLLNPVTVSVGPSHQKRFEEYLDANKIPYKVVTDDLENALRRKQTSHQSRTPDQPKTITFTQYHRHSEINAYLHELARKYPNVAKVEKIGNSHENRDMLVMKISSGVSDIPKPVIFVDAGFHAREWIAPAVALYLINQLVENPKNSYLIKNVDWIILPSANPDGYEYSWTAERLWRKTRSPGVVCTGVDPNRNFDFHWEKKIDSAPFQCFDTYGGPRPWSEIETRNIRDFILKTENIKAYLSLHSYGQYFMYPWSYTSDLPLNWAGLHSLAEQVSDAIHRVNGTRYTVGNSASILYAASGTSLDWAKGVAKVDFAFLMELPGDDEDFLLPPSRIQPVVAETFEGFRVLGEYFNHNYGGNQSWLSKVFEFFRNLSLKVINFIFPLK